MSILLVDDNLVFALATCEVLRDYGFSVVDASSADEAFDVIKGRGRLSALVTDIHLGPGPDGFEIARRARAAHPDVPVIYVSGMKTVDTAESVAGSEFLAKPLRRLQLVEALNRVISPKAG